MFFFDISTISTMVPKIVVNMQIHSRVAMIWAMPVRKVSYLYCLYMDNVHLIVIAYDHSGFLSPTSQPTINLHSCGMLGWCTLCSPATFFICLHFNYFKDMEIYNFFLFLLKSLNLSYDIFFIKLSRILLA
jgi:hypothetical protein